MPPSSLVCNKHNEVKILRKNGLDIYGQSVLRRVCKSCSNEAGRRYWLTHKEGRRAYRSVKREEARKFLQSLKDKPCADCGKKYPYYVMDFDHRPGEEKKFMLSHSTRTIKPLRSENSPAKIRRLKGSHGFTREQIEDEAKKCDVVCSNCHRERTHQRRTGALHA